MVIPITARPMIDSLLVGPEEFASVVANSETAFENSGVYIAFTDAADVFHRGYKRSGKDALKPAPWFPISSRERYGQSLAANTFASGVKNLRSGHFALGRAALKAALRGSGENLQIDSSRRPHALPNNLLPSDTWYSIQVRHSQEMQGPVKTGRFAQLGDPEVRGRLLQSLGLESSPYEIETEKKLATIFNDHKKNGSDRRLALKLWLEIVTAEASRVNHHVGLLRDRGVTLDKFLDVAFNLQIQITGSSNEGYQVLGHLLALAPQFDQEVSEFLRILEARLKQERPTKFAEESAALLNLYGGILACRGHGLREKSTYADSISYGALALLDFAKLPFLPYEVRAQALRFALYALPEFVPLGSQIAYDWLLWQIEVERDPHIAFLFASEYGHYFKHGRPTYSFQNDILRAALKRSDLDSRDRDALWERLLENRPIWSRWWRRAFRHIGPYADPRPPSPTRQPA